MKKHKNDLILISCVLLAAALLLAGISLLSHRGAEAVVSIDGQEYARYPLSEDIEVKIGDDAHFNLLVIEDGCASVTDASCPDKVCVNMGKISKSGQSIICLPNKLIVEIVGGEESGEDVTVR